MSRSRGQRKPRKRHHGRKFCGVCGLLENIERCRLHRFKDRRSEPLQ